MNIVVAILECLDRWNLSSKGTCAHAIPFIFRRQMLIEGGKHKLQFVVYILTSENQMLTEGGRTVYKNQTLIEGAGQLNLCMHMKTSMTNGFAGLLLITHYLRISSLYAC